MNASAIALWHALMSVANKTRWSKDFSVAISTLRSKTGIGKDALYIARNQLKQKGRIDYRERKGNQSTIYQIIAFASEKQTQSTGLFFGASDIPTQTPIQPPTQTPTQPPTQTPNNSKQNETIQNETFFYPNAGELLKDEDGATEIINAIVSHPNIPAQWGAVVGEAVARMYYAQGISVNGTFVEQERVRRRLLELDGEAVGWALEQLSSNTENVRNPVAYIMACLYNAPVNYDAAVSIEFARDFTPGSRIAGQGRR